MTEADEKKWADWHATLYVVEVSWRYHRRRRNFFRGLWWLVGLGHCQGVHRRLCNAYMRLIDRMTAQSFEETTQEQIEGYKREFAAIDAQEPPQLKTLVILCEYEACVARGQPDHVKRPPWWKRLVADFV
jgi:hypothetical protein